MGGERIWRALAMAVVYMAMGVVLLGLLTGCGSPDEPGGAPPAATGVLLATDTQPASATGAAASTVAPPPTEAPVPTVEEPPMPLAEACNVTKAAWIGTFGFGINCLDAAGWHLYTDENSPISNQVKDVVVCPDGRAWVLNSYGLDATDGTSWQSYRNAWGFGAPEAVACDGGTGVWLAHYEGVSHYDGTEWTTYEAGQLGTGENVKLVKDVAVGPGGQVWAVTANSVAAFDGQPASGGTWTVYETGKGFDKDYYFEEIAIDAQGGVWTAHGGGIWAFDGENWSPHEGKDLSQVNSLLVDGEDRVWAGTYARGVSVYDGKGWTTYTRADSGLSSDHVRSLALDARGRIWIGTQWGLNIRDGNDWQAYHMHTSGLADNEIYALAAGGPGPDLPAPQERVPGSLSGTIVRGTEPLRGAAVEVCAEYIGMVFSGPSPCADMAFSAETLTGDGGAFLFEALPVGRYGLALKTEEGKWIRLTEGSGLGDKQVWVREGQESAVGTLDVSK